MDETIPSTSAEAPIRPQDWATGVTLFAAVATVWSLARGRVRRALRWGALTVAADLTGRELSRRHPGPFPARLRFALVHPRGELERLLDALAPQPGERILEIGPGNGQHAVEVARAVDPGGQVDVVDIQPEMLDAVAERAALSGVANIAGHLADASDRLPFDDATFDAAYLNGVLGEIPDRGTALRELRRVLKPGGRLLVGEILLDPDFVPMSRLRREAESAGLALDERIGSPAAFCARFVAPS